MLSLLCRIRHSRAKQVPGSNLPSSRRQEPTARCSIYGDRPACCKSYQCLWREGFFNDEDRPDKSGVIAHFSPLDSGRIELDLTIDDRDKAVAGTVNRIHEWVAEKPFHQIMYRRIGGNVAMIQTRDGEI